MLCCATICCYFFHLRESMWGAMLEFTLQRAESLRWASHPSQPEG
jgi:hypothetical protein